MGAYDCDCINNLEYDRRERKTQLFCKGATKGATSDLISRQAVKYKLTALVNEFEEILAHIRERG